MVIRNFLVVICLFSISCTPRYSSYVNKKLDSAIMGGSEVQAGAPIAASIVGVYDTKEKYVCTGSLIGVNLVMTAAHCMEGNPRNYVIIFATDIDEILGAHEPDVKEQALRRVSDYRVHPQYNPREDEETAEGAHDIALVKFSGSLPAGYSPASFLKDDSVIQSGQEVAIAGYGVDTVETKSINPRIYPRLDKAISEGRVVCDDRKTNCVEVEASGDGILRHAKAKIFAVRDSEFVLDESKGSGTCSGDSGGPVYFEYNRQYWLFGITSRGSALCNSTGFYTNAIVYMDWLSQTAKILR